MNENQKLADRIAKLLEAEQRNDLASIFASLEKITHRLDKLETAAEVWQTSSVPALPDHPSREKFAIAEAIADQIFGSKEKACTFEPNRPCDHCSMCSSRGF
jgi:tetrahydromethanopterin S-methyltransferase subunit B